jgi:hypothetical protein
MRPILLSLCLLVVTGCTPSFDVAVTGWSDGSDASAKPYCIVPASRGTAPSDLEYLEFAACVKRGLADRGYKEASRESAELIVTLSYGSGGPYTSTYYYADPPGEAPAGAIAVASTESHPMGGGGRAFHGRMATGIGTGTGFYNDYGVVTVYDKWLQVAAYDKAGGGQLGPQRWRVDAVSSGPTADLRQVVPYLVAGSYQYFGQDTTKQLVLTVSKKDERYKVVMVGQ